MKKFNDNRQVTIEDLRKCGNYDQSLLNDLLNGDFKSLAILPIDIRANIDFMEPLLFGIKNEINTFNVFKYYAENLQRNEQLAAEIIESEPNLIENTPLSRDEQFIIKYAEKNPEIIEYMDIGLKRNPELIEKLTNIDNQEITKEIVKACEITTLISDNPELKDNKQFMKNAINENPKNIEYASDELKNDYEFMKDVCTENKETINYISEHAESFGENGLTAAKEVLVEDTTSKAISEIQTELQVVKDKMKEQEEQNVQDEDELKQTAIKKRQLENNMKFIQRIKEGKVSQERAIRLINGICKNLGEDYRKELMKYIKMDDAIIQKENEKEQESEENTKKTINKDDITRITDNTKLPELNKETVITAEAITQTPEVTQGIEQ